MKWLAELRAAVADSQTLLIVPPFASLARPALGVHILQSCARDRGHRVAILYVSHLLAQQIGEPLYEVLCHCRTSMLLGERFFAAAAFALPPEKQLAAETEHPAELRGCGCAVAWDEYVAAAGQAGSFIEHVAAAVAALPSLRVVGATTTFEQTTASLALLRALKRHRPELITILGGANCEGPMSLGLAQLAPWIDHFFSGESEISFPDFLDEVKSGRVRAGRIIKGQMCRDLDALPTPNFAEYYAQLEQFLPGSELKRSGHLWLPYESSRGCWWGAKHHCTFCGLNGEGMAYREKSPDRVIEELKHLVTAHPTNKVSTVDNIMPHRYFTTLLPRLPTELPGLHLFYEQKSNLSFSQVKQLKQAGVALIQPGIESLSSPLLSLMKKGVTCSQNLALLRYARMVGLALNWNLLYGFPEDRAAWYREMLELIPLIPHLEPPDDLFRLSVDRFSPYFERPAEYGLCDLRPNELYHKVFPEGCDLHQIAYHFTAEYASESLAAPELIAELREAITRWHALYTQSESASILLAVVPLGRSRYLLLDSRQLPGVKSHQVIGEAQARIALFGSRRVPHDESVEWAEAHKVVAQRDRRLVPLAITDIETYETLNRARPQPAALSLISS